ncbi:MAG: hypothetical protein WCF36_05135 [Candidatus Nanopelagicales bacterium]
MLALSRGGPACARTRRRSGGPNQENRPDHDPAKGVVVVQGDVDHVRVIIGADYPV